MRSGKRSRLVATILAMAGCAPPLEGALGGLAPEDPLELEQRETGGIEEGSPEASGLIDFCEDGVDQDGDGADLRCRDQPDLPDRQYVTVSGGGFGSIDVSAAELLFELNRSALVEVVNASQINVTFGQPGAFQTIPPGGRGSMLVHTEEQLILWGGTVGYPATPRVYVRLGRRNPEESSRPVEARLRGTWGWRTVEIVITPERDPSCVSSGRPFHSSIAACGASATCSTYQVRMELYVDGALTERFLPTPCESSDDQRSTGFLYYAKPIHTPFYPQVIVEASDRHLRKLRLFGRSSGEISGSAQIGHTGTILEGLSLRFVPSQR